MTLDARARATAFRLLAKYGKACVLKKKTAGAYNAATSNIAVTETSHGINAFMDQPNRQELAGGQVVATDDVAMFAALGLTVEPAINDVITVAGRDRTAKMINRIWSGEQVALWRVGLQS